MSSLTSKDLITKEERQGIIASANGTRERKYVKHGEDGQGNLIVENNNNFVFSRLCALRDLEDFNDPEFIELAADWINGKLAEPRDDDELQGIIKSSERYTPTRAVTEREMLQGDDFNGFQTMEEMEASGVSFEVPEMVLNGVPRGCLLFIAGKSNAGKSMWARFIAAGIATGVHIPGYVPAQDPGVVCLVDSETLPYFIKLHRDKLAESPMFERRADQLRANFRTLAVDQFTARYKRVYSLSRPDCRAWTAEQLLKVNARFFSIDTARGNLRLTNENDNSEVSDVMQAIREEIALPANVALAITQHIGKAHEGGSLEKSDPMFFYTGASAFVDAAALTLHIFRENVRSDEEDHALTTVYRGKYKIPAEPYVPEGGRLQQAPG